MMCVDSSYVCASCCVRCVHSLCVCLRTGVQELGSSTVGFYRYGRGDIRQKQRAFICCVGLKKEGGKGGVVVCLCRDVR